MCQYIIELRAVGHLLRNLAAGTFVFRWHCIADAADSTHDSMLSCVTVDEAESGEHVSQNMLKNG